MLIGIIIIYVFLLYGVRSDDLDDSEHVAIGPNNKDIVFSVNCGGKEHVDIDGIRYSTDSLTSGIGSDYGTRWIIQGVSQQDNPLYQTERYGLNADFSYEFRLPEPGDYVLVMKFAEVYFQGQNQKVFDVTLNGHTLLSDFDIFAVAGGRAVAYDVIIPIQITKGNMIINEKSVDLNNGIFKLTFTKGSQDNPKINAFYLKRGTHDHLHGIARRHRVLNNEFNQEAMVNIDEHLQDELPHEQDYHDEPIRSDDDDSHNKFASGPPVKNPYEGQDVSNFYVPLIITVILVIPIVFCLLKM